MGYKKEEAFLEEFSGLKIFYRKFIAEDAKRTMIVVHGLGEHSGRYMNLVDYFDNKNTNFYLIDNRGHGKSDGQKGHVLLFDQYLDDLRIFVEKVRDESEHDLFLLGHSMGGNMVANYLIQRDSFFTGAILSGPGLKIAAKVDPIKEAVGKIVSEFLPALTMGNGLLVEHLSHDRNVVEAYINDPLVHDRVSARWFTQFLWAGDFALRNAQFIKCPTLVLQGGDDKIVDPAGSIEFYDNLAIEEKELHIFEGFYHEIFNEIGKEKVFAILEKWINSRCADEKKILSYVR